MASDPKSVLVLHVFFPAFQVRGGKAPLQYYFGPGKVISHFTHFAAKCFVGLRELITGNLLVKTS